MNRQETPGFGADPGTDPGTGPGAASGRLSHVAFFYRDEQEYVSYISGFASAGLAGAEPVFLAVPDGKSKLLQECLGGETSFLRYGTMSRTGRNPARLIPELKDFIDHHPGRRVRYVSEAVWPGRSAAELCEAARHEALVNLAFAAAEAAVLCPYDLGALDSSVLAGAERTHPAVVRNGRVRPAGSYAGRGVIPAECEAPLPPPPPGARVIDYETELRQVRRLVTSVGEDLGLSGERVTNLVIAASELTANTLRHTGGGGRFQIWHTDDEIICQVQDQGWITDPLAGRQRHAPDAPGHGLWVVNQVCDLVEMRTSRTGTTIRLHMHRGEPDEP